MESPGDSLKRCPELASILLIGSSGDGKSATINHLLGTDEIKTGEDLPETKETLQYWIAINDHGNKTPNLKLAIIDTPGLNSPDGIKQDACNLYSMVRFFETHPLYSKPTWYPNIIFLIISANEKRFDGSGSKLANTLRALKELNVVDQHHPNVVVVLTFCCSVAHQNIEKWEKELQGKKTTISRNIHQALGIKAPTVVLLENDQDNNDLETSDDFTLLPNKERQPENLYIACQEVLEGNEDQFGLLSFNVGLAHHDGKKQYKIADHKVMATDSKKFAISEDEQHLLNILRGSTEDGTEVMKTITGGRTRRSSRGCSVLDCLWVLLVCMFGIVVCLLRLLGRLLRYTGAMWASLVRGLAGQHRRNHGKVASQAAVSEIRGHSPRRV